MKIVYDNVTFEIGEQGEIAEFSLVDGHHLYLKGAFDGVVRDGNVDMGELTPDQNLDVMRTIDRVTTELRNLGRRLQGHEQLPVPREIPVLKRKQPTLTQVRLN